MDLQKKIYNFILDYWKLVKKYTPRPKDEDITTWEQMIDDVDELSKKYKDGSREYDFFKGLIVLWLRYVGKDDLKDV